jgi:hypothetical protein
LQAASQCPDIGNCLVGKLGDLGGIDALGNALRHQTIGESLGEKSNTGQVLAQPVVELKAQPLAFPLGRFQVSSLDIGRAINSAAGSGSPWAGVCRR